MQPLVDVCDWKDLLLVAAVRRDSETNPSMKIASNFLADRQSRDDFIKLAGDHGVLGLVSRTLSSPGILSDADSRKAFEEIRRGCRRRAMVLQLERDNALRLLTSAGADVVVLKGAGLVSTAYDSAGDRDYGDIDVLIPHEQLAVAEHALLRQGFVPSGSDAAMDGYKEHHFHVRLNKPGGAIVEIHWAVTNAGEPFALSAATLMAESIHNASMHPARVPRVEHSLLHIVIENVRGFFTRLTRLVDIDRIITSAADLDWSYLEEIARVGHLLPALSIALETSSAVLGTTVPADFLTRISPSRTVRAHLAALDVPRSLLGQRAIRRSTWGLLLQLWLVDDRPRFNALARLWRGDDVETLEWLWMGEEKPRDMSPGLGWRAGRMGKLAVYQLGLYALSLRKRTIGLAT